MPHDGIAKGEYIVKGFALNIPSGAARTRKPLKRLGETLTVLFQTFCAIIEFAFIIKLLTVITKGMIYFEIRTQ